MLMALVAHIGSVAKAEISKDLKEKFISEMGYIGSLYQNYYAPKLWKEKHVHWDLSTELEKAKQDIQSASTVYDYRQAVVRFFNSMQDYHVGYAFESTESATLPIMLKTVEGKTIIVEIDRNKLSEASFPFHVGDEVVAFDDRPISEIHAELKKDLKSTAQATDDSITDMRLTSRSGRKNYSVPKDTVTLTLLRKGQQTSTAHQLNWEYQVEQLPGLEKNPVELFDGRSLVPFLGAKGSEIDFSKIKMESPISEEFRNNYGVAETVYGLGGKKPFLSNLGERIWETDDKNTFDAYIYKNDKGQLIGVIRIASYVPNEGDPKGKIKAVADFAQILIKMQKLTSGLVIDQLNNPGGSVFYLYSLASMLTDRTLYTPKHRMILGIDGIKECIGTMKKLSAVTNDEEAKKALEEDADGYPVTYQFALAVKNYCQFIQSQFNQGKKITDPFYIYGVDRINPSGVVQYTKPIVILVNELDFSGGDFFPATLQDNKRVTVVGTRTSGAGGYVNRLQIPNLIGLELFTITGSIAERIDKNPIENLGVTPDVQLSMTLEDYRSDFSHYLGEVKNILASKIEGN
jgi:hypothetical protein